METMRETALNLINMNILTDAQIAQASGLTEAEVKALRTEARLPLAQYWPEYDTRQSDMAMIGWHADTEDTANFFQYLTFCFDEETGAGQYNYGGY